MPLFWFRTASNGSGLERYTLQVPFQLGPTHALTSTDVNEVTFGDHRLEIVEDQGIQLLRVTDFKTPDEAAAFFPRLRGALLYLTVKTKLSLRSTSATQKVQLKDPPVDVRGNPNFGDVLESKGWTFVDGYVDPSPVVVIPEHLRIVEMGGGGASFIIGMPIRSFLEHLTEGLALPQPHQVAADERLALAVNLYAAALWETSPRAQVVSLATCLETVARPERVSPVALDQIDQLLGIFDSTRKRSAEDEEERRGLDRMRSRLLGLKEESISENLRKLAAAHANAIAEPIEDARRNMVFAYGVRSKLVHDGYAPKDDIEVAAAWLSRAVPAILESLVNNASGLSKPAVPELA